MKAKAILSLILIILSFWSCNNDDDAIIGADRETALLGQWDYAAINADRNVDLNGDGQSHTDLFGTQELRQCIKDNVTTFTETGPSGKPEYSVTENSLACDENGSFDFVEQDNWNLSSDNSEILFENRDPFRIVELTRNRLVVDTDDEVDGSAFIITITFNKR